MIENNNNGDDPFTALWPMLALAFQGSYLFPYMIMMPILFNAAKVLWKRGKTYFVSKTQDTIFIDYTASAMNDMWNNNYIYNRIAWYISENFDSINITQLRCSDSDYLNRYNDCSMRVPRECRETKQLYDLNESSENLFSIQFQGETIDLKFMTIDGYKGENRIKTYRIFGSSFKIIKDFVLHCENEYIAYHKKKEQEYYKAYEFSDNGWEKLDINVIKNRQNVFLNGDLTDRIIDDVTTFYNGRDIYDRLGIPYKRTIMLHGEPGTGKTSTIFMLAHEFQKNIYYLKLSSFNSEKQLKGAIKQIPAGSIIVFEDIDTVSTTHSRGKSKKMRPLTKEDIADIQKESDNSCVSFSSWDTITLDILLQILDGYCYFSECVLIFTTNHIEKIDAAVLRPGRVDSFYKYEFSTVETIRNILAYYYPDEYKHVDFVFPDDHIAWSSEIINSIIMPNIDNYQKVVDIMKN